MMAGNDPPAGSNPCPGRRIVMLGNHLPMWPDDELEREIGESAQQGPTAP